MGSVFLSTDNGSSWTKVNTGLVNPGPIRSFAIAGTNLYAGTTNNGVWRRPLSNMISTSVTMPGGDIPSAFALGQNYPNPFNPVTTIRYTVAGTGGQRPGSRKTRLIVYDLSGREVAVLVNEDRQPGTYTVRFDATGLASGVYFYRLQAESFVQTRAMVLTR